jgi:hypothetical protein
MLAHFPFEIAPHTPSSQLASTQPASTPGNKRSKGVKKVKPTQKNIARTHNISKHVHKHSPRVQDTSRKARSDTSSSHEDNLDSLTKLEKAVEKAVKESLAKLIMG